MAQSLYLHRALLEDENFKTCFNHHHHMMIAARIWKDGYIRQTAGYRTGEDDTRPTYVSWAICEVLVKENYEQINRRRKPHKSKNVHVQGLCTPPWTGRSLQGTTFGGILACMSWECIPFPSLCDCRRWIHTAT